MYNLYLNNPSTLMSVKLFKNYDNFLFVFLRSNEISENMFEQEIVVNEM